jgi:poly(A) polymerase
LSHPRFRAAYDFLLLRAETGGADQSLADWWTKFQDVGEAEQKRMTRSLGKRQQPRRRPKKSSKPKEQTSDPEQK